jgi:hypothetical protein
MYPILREIDDRKAKNATTAGNRTGRWVKQILSKSNRQRLMAITSLAN